MDVDDQGTRNRIVALLYSSIRTFVDLTEEHETAPGYQGLLRALAERNGADTIYIRVPIQDLSTPSARTIKCILDVIDRSMTEAQPVYVHCWAGRGRTGTVVGCYLKRHGLANDEDVIDLIAKLRRSMPNGSESSPQTAEQIRMVKMWQKGM